MKVDIVYTFKDKSVAITGDTPWEDEVSFKVGEIIHCGEKRWRITDVNHCHQGCFGVPDNRYHGLKIEPIDHSEYPNKGDDIEKEII